MAATHSIAVVDDDASVRKSMRRLLEVAGYAVETYSSAEDYFQNGLAEMADCLVLDVHLGGVSGLELQRQLRCADKQVPIVFVTANGDYERARIRALAAGARDFLRKQVDGERLLDAVQQALEGI